MYHIPKLEKDGKLTSENALLVYNYYLNTEKYFDEGVKKKPTKTSIIAAMIQNHSNIKDNIIQQYIDQGKNVYFWSDQHFGHQNVIKYCNRPFKDKEHMDKAMLINYNETVQDEDLVVWVGDIAFSGVNEYRQLLANLPGKKVLIMGNHDFDRKNKLKDFGIFSEVYMATSFYMTIQNKICNLILSHYPIDTELLPENTLNIHGHIHDKVADFKNINVSVEHTNYKPIDITKIITEKFLSFC